MKNYTTEREDFHSLFKIAIVYYNEKKYQDSYKYLKKAEKIDSTNHKLIFYLGMLYFKLKKYKEAREYLRKYIRKHKKELYPLIIIAKILIQEHRIAEAKKILIRISKKKQENISPPDNPFLIHFEAFKHLGICYYLKERWETACKWFKKAYHIKYNDTELIKYYTKALIKLNEISEVESIYNKYIEEHDYDKKLAEEIAEFYLEKYPNKSLLIYRKLYNQLELSIDTVIKSVSLLIKNKENIQEASMILDKYIVKFPDNISLRLKKGIVERMSGNYINAYECIRSAMEIDLSNIEAWFELGETHRLAGNYSDAKYCYKKVIELFDNIDNDSGNINNALENINYVLSSYIHLGKIAMNNSREQARKYFEKAIKLNPSDCTAYLYLLILYKVCHTTKFQEKKGDYNKKSNIIRKIADKTGIPLTIFPDLLLEIMKNKAYLTETYYEAIYTGIHIKTEKLEYFFGKLTHLHSEIENNLSETNFFEIEESLKKLLSDKENKIVLENLINYYLGNEDIDSAIEFSEKIYEKAIRLGSSRFKTFYLLAELEMEAGNLDSTVNYYKICLEIIQNNDKLAEISANNSQSIDKLKYNILKHLAEIYFIQKRYKAAISTIEKMREIHIFDSKILRILAESYWKIGEAERAVETYNEILKGRPDDTSVIIRSTEFLIEEDKFSEAEKFIKRLLNTIDKIKANKDIENYKSRIYYLAVLLFFKKNMIKKAIKYLEGYISTNKWDTKALKILAECYEKAGYQKKAADIYSIVIETQVSKNKTLKY